MSAALKKRRWISFASGLKADGRSRRFPSGVDAPGRMIPRKTATDCQPCRPCISTPVTTHLRGIGQDKRAPPPVILSVYRACFGLPPPHGLRNRRRPRLYSFCDQNNADCNVLFVYCGSTCFATLSPRRTRHSAAWIALHRDEK